MNTRVETEFTANDRDLRRKLDQLDARMNKFAANTARASQQSARSLQGIGNSIDQIGPMLTRMSGAFAGAFAAREVINLADTFTRFEAKLINAKVAAGDMAKVQKELFATAKANGQDVVSLADLYGNMAMSAKSLGLSQTEMMAATQGVAAAMRLSGSTTAQASATILQLGQALAGGTVRAEEYNSMLENAPALVRAVAESSTKWAGDLGKLRKEINDGKVSSQEWADAIVAASAKLQNDAAKAPLTVAAAMQNLQTSLVEYIGQADKSLGVTEKMGFALKMLGENLDLVANALIVVSTVIASRYAAGMVMATARTAAATVETIRYQMALAKMAVAQGTMTRGALLATTAMRGLSGAMAFFGGPIGLAITAIGLAVWGVSSRMEELKRRTQELPAAFGETESKIQEYKQAQLDAASATAEAAKAARDRAAALREETVALINKRRVEAQEAVDKATAANERAVRLERSAGERRATIGQRSFSNASTALDMGADAQARGARARADQLRAEADNLLRGLRRLEDQFKAPAVADTSVTPTPTPSTKSGGGRDSGPRHSAEEIAQASTDLETEHFRRLQDAMAALADTAEARHQNALQHLEWERDDAKLAIDRQKADGAITQAAADTAKADIDRTYEAQRQVAVRERQREIDEAARDLAAEQFANEQSILRIQQDTLRNRADAARTVAEKTALEDQEFALYQQASKADFEARQEEVRARLRLAGQLTAEAERRLQNEADAFAALQASEVDRRSEDKRRDNPFARFVDQSADINRSLQEVAADGLASLEDGLVSAIEGTASLADAFRNMSKQIIADLARIAIQKAIIGPLANFMGFGDGAGIFSGILGGGRKAIGTNHSPGGMTLVGEAGPEIVNMPKGSQVLPNGDVRKLLAVPKGSGNRAPVFNFTTHVNASGAVMADEIRRDMIQSHALAVQQARQLSLQDQAERGGRRLR